MFQSLKHYCTSQIEALANQMDSVHPKFWELKEDFENVKENVKQTTDSCTELCSELEATQGQLHCLMDDTTYLRQNLESTQEQINQTREEQVNMNSSAIEPCLNYSQTTIERVGVLWRMH